MHFTAKDLKGLHHGVLHHTEGIALLCGPNGAGKSSFLAGVAMLMSGHIDMTATDAPRLVRIGATFAEVTCTDDHGQFCGRLILPEKKRDVEDIVMPPVSKYAAGLVSVPEMTGKDRAQLLTKLCKTEPTKQDLINGMIKAAPSDEEKAQLKLLAERAFEQIEKQGWDKTDAIWESNGKEKKGEWQRATGKPRWGCDLGAKWLPEGWSTELEKLSEDDLQKGIAAEQNALEALIRAEAVNEADRAFIENEAARLNDPEFEWAVQQAIENSQHLQAELDKARGRVDALSKKSPKKEITAQCAHCDKPNVVVSNTQLRKPAAEMSKAELDKMKKELDDANDDVKRAEEKLKPALEKSHKLAAELRAAQDAKKQMETLAKVPVREGVTEESVSEQRKKIETLKKRLDAYRKKRDADAAHKEIVRIEKLRGLLGHEGLRAIATSKALAKVNHDILRPLCEKAECGIVEITSTLDITYKGLGYKWISGGEQALTRVILQIMVAKLDGSEWLVIDEVEDIDEDNCQGFITAVVAGGLPTIIAMTYSDRDAAPDMRAAELGQTLWLKDGIMEPLETACAK